MSNDEQSFTDARMLRKKAETKLQQKKNKSKNTEKEPDIKKLLHELQVHQIELEMQNEELLQAYQTTEMALKKYTMLYDFAPMGYFTLDPECSICDLNFTGAEMLGEKRFSLINTNFRLFISDDSKLVFDHFFNQVMIGERKESCKLNLGYNSNQLHLVYMEGVVTEDDKKCLLSVVDISDIKK